MVIFEKLKDVESKLSANIWSCKLNDAIEELDSIDVHNNLSIRKDNFARVLSTIKQLNLNYDDVVLFEPGAGDNIGGEIDRSSWLYSSNIANFFLRSEQKMFEYYAFDHLMRAKEDLSEDVVALNLFSFSNYMQKVSEVMDKGKLPIIFSNLVVGYIDKELDSVNEYKGWPKFWLAQGVHIHQYLSKDLMTGARGKFKGRKPEDVLATEIKENEEIRELSDELFESKMSEFMVQRYNIDKKVHSQKIINKPYSDTISMWVNY